MTDMITISRDEYEELIDIRDATESMRKVQSGEMPTIAESEVNDYMAAPTPLAFWRRKRGYTQASLAEAMGLSQPYVGQLENGLRAGDVATVEKLARLLKLRMEDLVTATPA